MAKKPAASTGKSGWSRTLENLLILQLGLAGVPQQAIRDVIGCDINRVNSIVKHLKKGKARKKSSLRAVK
jgi:hypothetical protein